MNYLRLGKFENFTILLECLSRSIKWILLWHNCQQPYREVSENPASYPGNNTELKIQIDPKFPVERPSPSGLTIQEIINSSMVQMSASKVLLHMSYSLRFYWVRKNKCNPLSLILQIEVVYFSAAKCKKNKFPWSNSPRGPSESKNENETNDLSLISCSSYKGNQLLLPSAYVPCNLYVLWFNINETITLLFMADHTAAAQSPAGFSLAWRQGGRRQASSWRVSAVQRMENMISALGIEWVPLRALKAVFIGRII